MGRGNVAGSPIVAKVRANDVEYRPTHQRSTNAAPYATIVAAVSIDGCCGARRSPNRFQSNSISLEHLGLPESARASICASEWRYPLTARPLEPISDAFSVEDDRVKGVVVEHRQRGSA